MVIKKETDTEEQGVVNTPASSKAPTISMSEVPNAPKATPTPILPTLLPNKSALEPVQRIAQPVVPQQPVQQPQQPQINPQYAQYQQMQAAQQQQQQNDMLVDQQAKEQQILNMGQNQEELLKLKQQRG